MAIVVGPTAGHVYPALAIAVAWRAAHADVDVRFVGVPGDEAARVLRTYGFDVEAVAGSPLVNVGAGRKLAAVPRVLRGIAQARRFLRHHGARLVIGLGGYASGSVLLAARMLGARVAIHEANVRPGLANRLLTPFAHRTWIASPLARDAFPRGIVTGHPIRAEIAALANRQRTAPVDRAVRVLVLSGTWGGGFLGEHAPPLLAAVARRGVALEVRHQTEEAPPHVVARAYRAAGVSASAEKYLTDVAAAYAWADVAIARAGAGTLAELAAAGLPAMIVPLAGAALDHQTANARVFAETGAAVITREDELSHESAVDRFVNLVSDREAWTAAAEASRRLAVPDAAERIVADAEAFMAGRW